MENYTEQTSNYTEQTFKSTLTGSIAFLMLSLPLSIVYFTLTIVGFSLGVGALVIWIGLPILFATLYMVHGMAAIERNLVRTLLRMPHPDQPYGRVPTQGFLRRFGSLLCDPYTWTGLLYMLFIKLPLGILSFVLTLTFLVLSICLTLLPLVYLVNLFVDLILIRSGVQPGQNILIPYFLEIHGSFDLEMFLRSFAGVPLGIVLGFMTAQMSRGLASFSGVLANAMLGPGATTHNMQPHTPTYTSSTRRAYADQRPTLNYAAPVRLAEQEISID
jgi:hypothetical protein